MPSLDEKLDAEIRAVDSGIEYDDIPLSELAVKPIQSFMISRGDDALDELANVAIKYGKNSADRHLNIYIHAWIIMCLSDYMVNFLPTNSGQEHRRKREEIAEYLKQELRNAYIEPRNWFDRERLSGDIVALGHGIVEFSILNAAAKVVQGDAVDLGKIDIECTRAVRNGYVLKVAGGRHDDTDKLRALIVIGTRVDSMGQHIEDFEELAGIVRSLIGQTSTSDLRWAGHRGRWHKAGEVFAEACHQLARQAGADDMQSRMFHFNRPVAFPYINAALFCFNRGIDQKSARFCIPKEEWPACREKGAGERCSQVVAKIQGLALSTLSEELIEKTAEPWDRLKRVMRARIEGMAVAETSNEDVPGMWDRKPLMKALTTVNIKNGDERLQLMVLAREIGAAGFGPDFQVDTIRRLAEKSPADRASLREQGQRLLKVTQDADTIRTCLTNLLNSPCSEHEGIVSKVKEGRAEVGRFSFGFNIVF
jgi:hypothetical protein